MNTPPTSFRLTEDTRLDLAYLAQRKRVSQANVLELLIRQEATRERRAEDKEKERENGK